MKNVEIEYKLDANSPRAFEKVRRFLAAFPGGKRATELVIKDTYLDHASHDLAAQKIALRVRHTNGKWEVTFKTRTQIQNGKAIRREETLPLPGVKNLAQALAQLELKKKWKGLNVCGLVPQFSVGNKRTVYEVNFNRAMLELALDRVTILVAGRQLKMKEIEVELKRGQPKILEQFCKQLQQQTNLKTNQISKVKTAECLKKMFAA